MPDFFTMLQAFANNLPGLYQFMTGLTVLTGFWFGLRGLYMLRQYGELRTMMSVQTELKKPLLYLLTACVLVYWPSMLHVMMKTMFTYQNPLQYQDAGNSAQYDLMVQVAGLLIQFVGFVGFVRGWILLAAYGEGGQQTSIAKPLLHIFGGILAINIFASWTIIKNSFGI